MEEKTVLQDLEALHSGATTNHVRDLIGAEIARVRAEAASALRALEAHLEQLPQEARELWERVRKVL